MGRDPALFLLPRGPCEMRSIGRYRAEPLPFERHPGANDLGPIPPGTRSPPGGNDPQTLLYLRERQAMRLNMYLCYYVISIVRRTACPAAGGLSDLQ